MLQDAIVLISSADPRNKRFGTGFVIYRSPEDTFILTCAHVVLELGAAEQLRVDNVAATIVVLGEESEVDLAILKVGRELNKASLTLRGNAYSGNKFVTIGFQQYGKRILTRPLQGELGSQVNIAQQKGAKRINAWDLSISSEHSLQKGYSGSPVIDIESQAAIGVISDREGEGRKGLAISLSSLVEIWNDIPPELSKALMTSAIRNHNVDQSIFTLYSAARASTSIDPQELLRNEVNRIYILLGGQVQLQVLVNNVDLGLKVTFRAGPLSFNALAACKVSSKTNLISAQDIQDLVLKLSMAREHGIADKGVFVTTQGYDAGALGLAKNQNIQCLTLEELYNQLIDFREYSQNHIDDFAQSELNLWHIDSTGSDIEDYDLYQDKGANEFLHHPLIEYVDYIFFVEHEKRLALLGNFGTGKSSFCQKYCDILMRRYVENRSQRIPVLLNLRDYRSGIDIHQVITNHLQRLPGVKIDTNLCVELQRTGRFFFILDGLDEMATKVDRVVINENLREIERLYTEGNNLYLITCRTHFFQERIADEILQDYRVVYLTEWGNSEIESYLQKRFPETWQLYLRRIFSNTTLADLSKTPLLLDMIVRSLSELSGGKDERINTAKLYDAYVQEWIVRQSNRRGAVMNARQRRMFVETLSSKLYEEDKTELHYSELYEVAREFSGYGDATKLDYFDSDARTCTFITKDSLGNYGFKHRSFLEFFCATCIIQAVENDKSKLLESKSLTPEVLQFILDLDTNTKGIANLHAWSEKFENKLLSANAVRILLGKNIQIIRSVAQHHNISDSMWDALRQAIENDDDHAMDDFVRRSEKELRQIAQRAIYGLDLPDEFIDEILQDTYFSLWSRRDRIKLGEATHISIKSYITRIMKNLATDRARKEFGLRRYSDLDISADELPAKYSFDNYSNEIESEVKDEVAQIKEILNASNFSDITKRVFREVYFEERSRQDVASKFGITNSSLNAMLNRAIRHVRKEIDRQNILEKNSNQE